MTESTETKSAALSRRERRAYIVEQFLAGRRSRDIANELGITRQRVCAIANSYDFDVGSVGHRGGTVSCRFWTSRRVSSEVERMALAAGISKASMEARMIKAMVDNPSLARRLMEREEFLAKAVGR